MEEQLNNSEQPQETKKLYIGWCILSVLIPIVGFILYFVFKKENITKAKVCLIAACVGAVINIICMLLGIE